MQAVLWLRRLCASSRRDDLRFKGHRQGYAERHSGDMASFNSHIILLLFHMRNFMIIANSSYSNNFAELVLQGLEPQDAIVVCVHCWLHGICGTMICILSVQRVTYAIARDGLLSGSKQLQKLSKRREVQVSAAPILRPLVVLSRLSQKLHPSRSLPQLPLPRMLAIWFRWLHIRRLAGSASKQGPEIRAGSVPTLCAVVASLHISFLACALWPEAVKEAATCFQR